MGNAAAEKFWTVLVMLGRFSLGVGSIVLRALIALVLTAMVFSQPQAVLIGGVIGFIVARQLRRARSLAGKEPDRPVFELQLIEAELVSVSVENGIVHSVLRGEVGILDKFPKGVRQRNILRDVEVVVRGGQSEFVFHEVGASVEDLWFSWYVHGSRLDVVAKVFANRVALEVSSEEEGYSLDSGAGIDLRSVSGLRPDDV